jgi:hypothetical protein
VTSGGVTTFSWTFTPQTTGTYSFGIRVQAQNTLGAYIKTDGWAWNQTFAVAATGSLNVAVKNVGGVTDLTVWPRQFWLTDAANKRVKPFETDLAAFNAQQVRPVAIGMGAHTTFVYEIPKGSEGYDFHFRKRKTSPTIYSWQVW